MAATVICGVLGGVYAAAQAYVLALLVAAAFGGEVYVTDLLRPLALLLAIIILRGALNWREERNALSLGSSIQQSLRRRLLKKIDALGPVKTRERQYGELLTLLTEGLDALETYFQKYLPQLCKSAILPLIFLLIVFPLDWPTGTVMVLTAPLVPVFMALIGRWTKHHTLRQWQALTHMGGYFQDIFEGLSTLKLFNRVAGQREKITALSEGFRVTNLQVLKWGFLSALVLEMLTTISVAMIAVGLGLRLVYGLLDFRSALFLLFLAPEFYLPLRSLSAQYHSSLNGAAAAKSIFALLAQEDDGICTDEQHLPAGVLPLSLRDIPLASEGDERSYTPLSGCNLPPSLARGVARSAGGSSLLAQEDDSNIEQLHTTHYTIHTRAAQPPDLVFENVSFTYEAGRPALNGVSFTLKAGEKLGLVGVSGSGKTTLLHLLAGFIRPDSGTITLGGQSLAGLDADALRRRIALVSQDTYLFQGSLMENIRLGRNEAGAEAVIAVCRELGLHDVFSALPQGYDTPLGQGGRALSGGERQMLAIARACLKDAPLLLLDEATRNVDWKSDYLLQQALARLSRGKTVIAAAHRLQTLAGMDKLLVLAQGKIARFGPLQELQEQPNILYSWPAPVAAALSAPPTMEQASAGASVTAMAEPLNEPLTLQPYSSLKPPTMEQASAGTTIAAMAGSLTEPLALPLNSPSALPPPPDAPNLLSGSANKKQVPTQNSKLKTQNWSAKQTTRMLKLCRPYAALISGSCILSASAIAANIALLGFSSYLISRAALAPPLLDLMTAIVAVRFFGISRAILRYAERYVSHDITLRILTKLRLWYYDQMEKLSYVSLQKLGLGRVFKHIINDVDILKFFYLRVLTVPAQALLICAAAAFFLSFFSWQLALILSAFFCTGGIVCPFLLRRLLVKRRDDFAVRRQAYSETLYDYINGLADQQICGDTPRRLRIIEDQGQALARERYYTGAWDSFAAVLTSLLANLALFAALTVMIDLVAGGRADALLLAAVIWVMWASFEALQPVAAMMEYLHQSRGALAGMEEAAARPPEPPREGQKIPPPAGGLKVENLSFAYEKGQSLLTGISFTLKPGSKTALLGSSGAGKTTLLNILIGFLPYEKGRILSGGIDLGQVDAASLRQHIGYLEQRPYLFHASIRENILIAKENASEQELQAATAKARLADFISGLPAGYDTIVGENGYKLSAGQRQRLALARLFLQDAPLIILDEATQSLDRENRDSLFTTLSEWWRDKTVLYVTHDSHGLAAMDNILILDKGRLV